MHYIISWQTNDHAKSIPHYLKHGHDMPPGVKVLSSWHVVAQPRGYVLVEVTDAAALHGAIIKWGDIVDVTVEQVISDADAVKVVSGGAGGVDLLGERWALEHDVAVVQFLPDWRRWGRRAGMMRNAQMADYADGLVAVWDGTSPGTKDMIHQMKRRNKPVRVHIPGSSRLIFCEV